MIDPIAAFRPRFGGWSSGRLSLQQLITVTISNEINVLVVGVLLVVFVVAAPDGVLGLLRKLKWFHRSSR